MTEKTEDLIAEARKAAKLYDRMVTHPAPDIIEREAGRNLQYRVRLLADALEAAARERDAALAAIERVRVIHRNAGPSQGYDSRFKGGYGMLGDCCDACGSHGEYGVEWPCPTIQALDGAPEPEGRWEYRARTDYGRVVAQGSLDEIGHLSGHIWERRRKAGPWGPVEGEKP